MFVPQINKTTVMVASRGGGKTVACQRMIKESSPFANAVDSYQVHSNGISVHQYDMLLYKGSPHRIYPELNIDAIRSVFEINQRRRDKSKVLINFCLIFDDCIDKQTGYDKDIQRIFTQGRHFSISIIYLSQSISMGLHPTIKRNTDTWFIWQPRIKNDVTWLYENILCIKYEKEEALKLIRSLEPFECIIATFQSSQLELFKYKAYYKHVRKE